MHYFETRLKTLSRKPEIIEISEFLELCNIDYTLNILEYYDETEWKSANQLSDLELNELYQHSELPEQIRYSVFYLPKQKVIFYSDDSKTWEIEKSGDLIDRKWTLSWAELMKYLIDLHSIKLYQEDQLSS